MKRTIASLLETVSESCLEAKRYYDEAEDMEGPQWEPEHAGFEAMHKLLEEALDKLETVGISIEEALAIVS